jgi:hypothetical protein
MCWTREDSSYQENEIHALGNLTDGEGGDGIDAENIIDAETSENIAFSIADNGPDLKNLPDALIKNNVIYDCLGDVSPSRLQHQHMTTASTPFPTTSFVF